MWKRIQSSLFICKTNEKKLYMLLSIFAKFRLRKDLCVCVLTNLSSNDPTQKWMNFHHVNMALTWFRIKYIARLEHFMFIINFVICRIFALSFLLYMSHVSIFVTRHKFALSFDYSPINLLFQLVLALSFSSITIFHFNTLSLSMSNDLD